MLISCGIAAGGDPKNPSKCFDFKAESNDFFEKKNSDLPCYKTKTSPYTHPRESANPSRIFALPLTNMGAENGSLQYEFPFRAIFHFHYGRRVYHSMHGTLEILWIVMIHEMGIPIPIQQLMEERNDSSHSLTKRYKISFPNQTNKMKQPLCFEFRSSLCYE